MLSHIKVLVWNVFRCMPFMGVNIKTLTPIGTFVVENDK